MAPPVEAIHEARKLFNELEYPILFHCKSGADRAGLMGALFMYMKEGKPIEEALKQLSLKLALKKSETGVLDYLRALLSDNDAEPMTFSSGSKRVTIRPRSSAPSTAKAGRT